MYKILEIKINGPFGSNYDLFVDFKDKKAIYKKQDAMFLDIEKFNRDLDDTQLSNFISKLDEYKILEWDEQYGNLDEKSGYKWQVRVIHEERELTSAGIVVVPEEWDKLCKELTILLGTKFG